MKWNKYTITTTTEAVDMISYTLGELGIQGIEVEDKIPLTEDEMKSMFIDMVPDLGPDDGEAKVSFYIEPENDSPVRIKEIMDEIESLREFMEIGPCTLSTDETADIDWMNNWKKFWKPFKVDENIIIKPTWETLPPQPEGTLVVEIDPGSVFGTGTHHTTKLVIKQIAKYLKKDSKIFDIGCGSGILSIIAMMLGAKAAAATDVDPNAVTATKENAIVNKIDLDNYKVLCGDVITDKALLESIGNDFDIIVANIFADIIIPLNPVIDGYMKPGTIYITSGIINTRAEDVKKSLIENGFEIIETTISGDWVAFTSRVGGKA